MYILIVIYIYILSWTFFLEILYKINIRITSVMKLLYIIYFYSPNVGSWRKTSSVVVKIPFFGYNISGHIRTLHVVLKLPWSHPMRVLPSFLLAIICQTIYIVKQNLWILLFVEKYVMCVFAIKFLQDIMHFFSMHNQIIINLGSILL